MMSLLGVLTLVNIYFHIPLSNLIVEHGITDTHVENSLRFAQYKIQPNIKQFMKKKCKISH